MNAALMSFVRQWMNDNDREKEKKEQRAYNEKQRDIEWEREDNKALASRMQKDNRELEAAKWIEKNPVEANSMEVFRKSGILYPIQKDEARYSPATAQWKQEQNLRAAAIPVESQIKYASEIAKVTPTINRIATQFPGWTTEEIYGAVGGNPELSNVMQNVTAAKGIEAGVPERTVKSTLTRLGAQEAGDELSTVRDRALIPRAGEAAKSDQTAGIVRNAFGGASPSQALIPDKSTAYTVVNPETGEVEVIENPYANRLVKDPLQGMIGGNSMLSGVAEQLGMEKRPMKFDASGRPERVARPAIATPSAFMPKFSGNLATDTGRTDFGKSTLNEALDAAGVLVTPEGTVQAKPVTIRYPYSPFATSNRDPNEEEAEARRQRAIQIINYYQKNRQ